MILSFPSKKSWHLSSHHAYLLSLKVRITMLSSSRNPSRHAQTAMTRPIFPGDPHLMSLPNHRQVMFNVLKKEFLRTALLDYYTINLTTSVPNSSSFTDPGVQQPSWLGSLGAKAFVSSMNLTASTKKEHSRMKTDWKAYQDHICKVCTKFKNPLNHNGWLRFSEANYSDCQGAT